jgi:hypothetical protein
MAFVEQERLAFALPGPRAIAGPDCAGGRINMLHPNERATVGHGDLRRDRLAIHAADIR